MAGMGRAENVLAHNVRLLGHLDLPGGGQVTVRDGYAYVGHMKPPHGTTILDVADPARPRVVSTVTLADSYSHTHKVRVVDDLMFVNAEMNNRHFLRKGERIPGVAARIQAEQGRPASPQEIAQALGVAEADLPILEEAARRGYGDGGFRIYDIADRTRPREIAYVRTHGIGVHRFDVDDRYAYISTEMEGFLGNILVIYDIGDPTHPCEVSRW